MPTRRADRVGSTAATTASATAQITAPETNAAMRRSRRARRLVPRAPGQPVLGERMHRLAAHGVGGWDGQ